MLLEMNGVETVVGVGHIAFDGDTKTIATQVRRLAGAIKVKDLKTGEQAQRELGDWFGAGVGGTYTRAALLDGLGGRVWKKD